MNTQIVCFFDLLSWYLQPPGFALLCQTFISLQPVSANYTSENTNLNIYTISFESLLLNRDLYLEWAYIQKNLPRMKAKIIFYRARL